MDNRLPYWTTAGRYPGAAAATLPPYLGEESGNGSSSSSRGSILSQLPLPYHSSEGYAQQQPLQDLRSSAGTPLNPTSAPYVPPTSDYLSAFQQRYGPPSSLGHQPASAVNQSQPTDHQYYGQGFATTEGGAVRQTEFGSSQFQSEFRPQFDAPLQGPYGEYAAAQYARPQDMNYQAQGYHQAQAPNQYIQAPVPTQYSQAPAATQYTQPANFGSQATSYTSYGPPQATITVATYGVQPPPRQVVLPSNANRGKTAVKPTQSGGPKLSGETKSRGQRNRGGPVLPPSSSMTGGESAGKRHSMASSSQTLQLTSQTTSGLASPGSVYSDFGSPTPLPKKTRKDVSFTSEVRSRKTPVLRSRRGQSLQSSSATDPTSKTTVDWLAKLPDRAPPPKMMSLLTNQIKEHKASKLKSPNETDPFSGNTSRSLVRGNAAPVINNPFATQQLTVSTRVPGPDQGMSPALRALTNNGRSRPTVEQALDTRNLPFVEYCRIHDTSDFGVIKLRNIPYSVNRSEVMAFLGRNARIISEHDYEPIHIVMERVTSKTLDCYVEFINVNEAIAAVGRYESNRSSGRNGRLGQRHVEMEMSSEDELMRDLFPKAKNVIWRSGQPFIIATDPNDRFNSGFQGFVSNEEIVMMVKHVEAPQRSPFSKECPQRPYECLISTLLKYPWHMVDYITIEDRNLIFDCTIKMLDILRDRLEGGRSGESDLSLTRMLFKRIWRAALRCPGFSPTMKDEVVFKNFIDGSLAQEYGVPLFAADWKYVWTIGPKPGAPHDLILWYAAIIRETTTANVEELSLAEKAAQGNVQEGPKLFGNLEKYFGHPTNFKNFQHMTLAQVAANEWAGIEAVLRQAFAPCLEGATS